MRRAYLLLLCILSILLFVSCSEDKSDSQVNTSGSTSSVIGDSFTVSLNTSEVLSALNSECPVSSVVSAVSKATVSKITSQISSASSSVTHPAVTLSVSESSVQPGGCVIFKVNNYSGSASDLIANYSSTSSVKYPLVKANGCLLGFAPVTNLTYKQLGNLQIVNKKTGAILLSKKITLISRTFDKQYLTVEPGTDMSEAGSTANLNHDKAIITSVTKASATTLLFTGNFIMPVTGEITTQFGQRRYTNGVFTSAHSGYDIAADHGTPVNAAGAGVVVYAGTMLFYGNTVIIDHGLSIYSFYNHMSKIVVEDNQKLETGQKIGEVGSTGYSTGDHLHFNVWVDGTNVDPALFMTGNTIYQQLERMISQ